VEVRCDAEVGLVEVDEGGEDRDRVGRQVYQLDAVEVQKPTQKIACEDAESALDVREEDDGLAGSLRQECLSRRRPPPDLHLGPQQPAVHQ
jgi:hypothetical protein